MTTIESSTPRDLPAGASPTAAPGEPPASIGALSFAGTPEAVLAAALLALEDAERRQEILRADALRQRFEQRVDAIRDRHRESRLALAAGIAGGLAEIAEGTAKLVGAGASANGGDDSEASGPDQETQFRARCALQSLDAGAKLAAPLLGFYAKGAALDAAWHDVRAEASEDASKRATRARDEADQSADRMRDGIRELGRLRHEAALAALRG